MMVQVFGNHDINTPTVNIDGSDVKEIEVIDPTHPLYRRKFNVSIDQLDRYRTKSVRVEYKDDIKLSIAISSTNFNPIETNSKSISIKLTLDAVKQIVLLTQELNLCQSTRKKSGKKSQKKFK